VLAARLKTLAGTVTVKGTVGDRPWAATLRLDKAAPGAGLSKLWARRKIDDAEVAWTMQQITQEEADKRIVDLALEHHLVTRLTSLVAVEQKTSRPKGEPIRRADVPLNLPAGWDFDKVFGPSGESAPSPDQRKAETETRVRVGSADLPATDLQAPPLPAASPPGIAQLARPTAGASRSIVLPQTATDAELRLWVGLALLLAALLVASSRDTRRRNAA
jgi:Ca-activated chloride channel family protein